MKSNEKVVCPCCRETLIISMEDNKVILNKKATHLISDAELDLDTILDQLNIELG